MVREADELIEEDAEGPEVAGVADRVVCDELRCHELWRPHKVHRSEGYYRTTKKHV